MRSAPHWLFPSLRRRTFWRFASTMVWWGPDWRRSWPNFGNPLPQLRLAFIAEGAESPEELRDGRVDLDTGVLEASAPGLVSQLLLWDPMVAVPRRKHPALKGRLTPKRFAGCQHLGISREGQFLGPIDSALKRLGLTREVAATISSPSAAAFANSRSDWITAMHHRPGPPAAPRTA